MKDVWKRLKDMGLVPPRVETDDADAQAIAYFREHNDGKEHFVVYNGEMHDGNLPAAIGAGKPLIFFRNHPAGMFPTPDDYGTAALYLSMVYRENPRLSVQFRIVQLRNVVSYGFKGPALDEIRHLAGGAVDTEAIARA